MNVNIDLTKLNEMGVGYGSIWKSDDGQTEIEIGIQNGNKFTVEVRAPGEAPATQQWSMGQIKKFLNDMDAKHVRSMKL